MLLFYYQQIALGNTDPVTIRDYLVTEALVSEVDPQLVQEIVGKESKFNTKASGDNGESAGAWQIHLPAHKDISREQAEDIIWATNWSLNQLKEGNCKIWSTCPLTKK